MIGELLEKCGLPPLRSREEMLDLLLTNVYGRVPAEGVKVTWCVKPGFVENFCAGNARLDQVIFTCEKDGRSCSFPVYAAVPVSEGKHPFFIHINFRDCVPDRYMPTEEIIDQGFAVLSVCYSDITTDDGDFTNGLAGVIYKDGRRNEADGGKIALWAFALQRILDFAETQDDLDLTRAAVCGHSRLGKTALLTGALDPRFRFVYSNDSGCSGAALSRDKGGESIEVIDTAFPFWFCENYSQWKGREHSMPFDQHYLLACIAPRFLCVGSASEDDWADPRSEFLSCCAAAPAFETAAEKGFVCEDRMPVAGDCFFEGKIGYHLRKGTHYFGREDWNRIIKFIQLHS